ncbi:MAG TPA: MauE/DoxX family redox-associated membrane protein [Bryobacteraceae bacterium]|nr:MauE/DoxX family redox-associated membrane protein [Bryobacteraceae bacterium]
MRRLILPLRLIMAAVFLYAAYTKLREPWLVFAMSIDAYQLLPQWAVLTLGRTIPWLELLLGLLLAMGIALRYTAAAAAILLGVFFGIMVHAYAQGLKIDCGCFGLGEPITARTLLRDGLLLAACLTLTFLAVRQRARRFVAQENKLATQS